MRNITPLTLALLILEIFSASSCAKKEESVSQEEASSTIQITEEQFNNITLDTVHLINQESDLLLTGKISFDEDKITKVFPLVGGIAVKVNVTLGDYVHKGEVLAILHSNEISDYENQAREASSNLQVAKKNMEIAEELYKTNSTSERDYFISKTEYQKAISEVSKLKQQLAVLGANENDIDAEYRIRAPIEGYIVEKNITENEEIRSDKSENIFTVSSLKTVWVIANVYESDLSKVKEGDDVKVTTIAYPDKVLKGKIKHTGNLIDPETMVMKIRIVLENPDGMLKPEMFASVTVHLSEPKKVLAIPASALIFDNNRFYVMLYVKDRSFEQREIKVLLTEKEKAFVEAGLSLGDQVISRNGLFVFTALKKR